MKLKNKLIDIPNAVLKLICDIVKDGKVTDIEQASLDAAIKLYDLDKESVYARRDQELEKVLERLRSERLKKILIVLGLAIVIGLMIVFINPPDNPHGDSIGSNSTNTTGTIVEPTLYAINCCEYVNCDVKEAKQGDIINYTIEKRKGYKIKSIDVNGEKQFPIRHEGTFIVDNKPVYIKVEWEIDNPKNYHELDYGTWTGKLVNGKPDGKGTLILTKRHLLHDLSDEKVYAEPGQKVIGKFENGNLISGYIYDKYGKKIGDKNLGSY